MPRLGKRKRDALDRAHEESLGGPRLADLVISGPWEPAWWIVHSGNRDLWRSSVRLQGALPGQVAAVPVIVADNVARFYFEHDPRPNWSIAHDFPCVAPPFDSFFIEMDRPSRCVEGDRVTSLDWAPPSWGWLFRAMPVVEFSEGLAGSFGDNFRAPDGAKWALLAHLVSRWENDRVEFPSALAWLFVDQAGNVLPNHRFSLIGGKHLTEDRQVEFGDMARCLFQPVLLTISFMNCRNVQLLDNQPHPELNRIRQRRGDRPFVRYHTIDIEPMKRVLRTEGRADEVGLRRALHIVRGHFSTYTSERPLFGKVAGTFWVPAHVRGSIEEGVVVSDYRVNAASEP